MNTLIEAILADPSVGVDFKAALAKADESRTLRRAEYVSALRRMDWQFEFSDDHRAWQAGRDELQRLRGVRDTLDVDCAIWRANVPKEFFHG